MSESNNKKDTTDEAIRKILQQSSFPKSSSGEQQQSGPVKRKANHARNFKTQPQQKVVKLSRSCPVAAPPAHQSPPPAPQQQQQQQQQHSQPGYTVLETTLPLSSAHYDMVSTYQVISPTPILSSQTVQYHTTQTTSQYSEFHHQQPQQQQYDFSVSDSDRLVRALGLDFAEPVQRELSAK